MHSNQKFVSNSKVVNILYSRLEGLILLSIFVFAYDFLYRDFLAVSYAYLGFAAESQNSIEFIFAIGAVLLGYFALPTSLQRFSDFFLWFFFGVVFVPSVLTASRMGTLPDGSYSLVSLMTVSFILMNLITTRISAPRLIIGGRKDFLGHRDLVFLVLISLCVLVLAFNSIMAIPSIENIYVQREIAGQFGANRLIIYMLNWTTYAIIPTLYAFALGYKRQNLIIFCLAAFFIVFMINAAKIVFISAILMYAIKVLFKNGLAYNASRIILVPLVPTILVFFILVITDELTPNLNFIVSQILMRSLVIQAVMMTVYVEFFTNNPLTYMSHVTGISTIIDYPYSLPMGKIIGIYLVGGNGFNANANFIATDGIGSFGLIGIPIASVLTSLVLVIMNMILAHKSLWFVCLALTPFCLAAANTSFFTSLVTGGGMVACILITKFPEDLLP